MHGGHRAIAVLNVSSRVSSIFAADPWDEMMPAWSRDGRWIYYASAREATVQIWRKPVAGGVATQITRNGGGEAKESADGSKLYYTRSNMGIFQLPVDGGEEAPVPGLVSAQPSRHWTVTKRGIYFLNCDKTSCPVSVLEFASGKIKAVTTFDKALAYLTPSLAVSADDRWLLHSHLDETGSDLMLLENAKF
jgi:dipeptidyl aminopeptidase/acylaminoacyl peptidase